MSINSRIYLGLGKIYRNLYTRNVMYQSEKVCQVLQPQTVDIACNHLLNANVIALPTDTVYGLACDANNERAIQKLYEIKGRNFCKPVAICVKDLVGLRKFGMAEHLDDKLLNRLLPGPITIVVKKSQMLNNRFLNPKTSKIGIRIPDFPFIHDLCGACHDKPIALTSANRSGEPSSLNIKEFESLWPDLGAIFDAGQIGLTEERRCASTVIDLSVRGKYKIVRDGVALKTTLEVLHDFGLVSL